MDHSEFMRELRRLRAKHPHPRIEREIVIDGVRFDAYSYDERGDMLALFVEDGRDCHPWADGTDEGHYVKFAHDDDVLHQVGFSCPKHHLARDGYLEITVYEGGPTERIPREAIEPLLVDTPIPRELSKLFAGRVV